MKVRFLCFAVFLVAGCSEQPAPTGPSQADLEKAALAEQLRVAAAERDQLKKQAEKNAREHAELKKEQERIADEQKRAKAAEDARLAREATAQQAEFRKKLATVLQEDEGFRAACAVDDERLLKRLLVSSVRAITDEHLATREAEVRKCREFSLAQLESLRRDKHAKEYSAEVERVAQALSRPYPDKASLQKDLTAMRIERSRRVFPIVRDYQEHIYKSRNSTAKMQLEIATSILYQAVSMAVDGDYNEMRMRKAKLHHHHQWVRDEIRALLNAGAENVIPVTESNITFGEGYAEFLKRLDR